MSIKKITAIFLFLFLCPYLVSTFCSSEIQITDKTTVLKEDMGKIDIEIEEEAGVRMVSLENYILGILPSVIPVTYETEALKAQAILLRTQLIREYEKTGKAEKLEGVSWMSAEQMKTLWGIDFTTNYSKLEQAVNETRGLYLLYGGEPILASYFRVSNGRTRSGHEALHSNEYPYLNCVSCEKDFAAEDYLFQKKIKIPDFCERLCIIKEDLDSLQVYKDESGYCSYVSIYRQKEKQEPELVIGGECFRAMFELPSSGFEIKIEENEVHITVKGVGHGLGMSQFAANEMAKSGEDYMEILTYFFTDIAFDKFE